MFFRDVIGQEDVKQRLIHSVKTGQIAHAQLFCGPEGVGKFPLALAYARYIQCTNKGENDACGQCPSCKQYNNLMHPDLHFVFPIVKNEKKKKRVSDDYIEDWRLFLAENTYFNLDQWLEYIDAANSQAMIYAEESREIIRKISLKTYESDYKVMIIWLPERMNAVCANKLLKLLEEPYDKTVFLLVSDNASAILGTILSRTQPVHLRPLSEDVVSSALVTNYSLSPEDASAIAHIASGNYLRALESIRVSDEMRLNFDLFVRLMRLAYGRKIKDLKLWSEEISDLGREKERIFLSYAQRMLRENFIYNIRQPEINYMTTQEAQFSSRFAPFIHERNVYPIMEELSRAYDDIGQNANGKIVFFDLAIKMIMLLKS
ncbi:DNA polymerase III subunit delta' [Coprobacter secundus]|jgi:DNA polymerase III, delta' subunit|uniref:DNA polymerase III subunit delta n=1 Tax=Coprobacter secundus subsp. similis TaxID=2751153 RepID=A0A7G1HXW9_9BACT|nr:DNA polymerase III subunit delta' [Coprobacter secundus]KHM47507.1 DNA polymerase III subunit delta [Coprobacter secundus]BCI64565.1 DNA polymerase III subunit delta [Coprobacter secundus subsp. similis]CCY39213.1 dNA polymerase III delta' subunit [Tannerella sp. CAG:118]